MPDLEANLRALQEWFKDKESVLVALSGGVDSSLVAAVAKKALGDRAIAVTEKSPTLPSEEFRAAKKVAEEIGIELVVVKANELANPNFAKNPTNRCYYCKSELVSKLRQVAKERGIATIVDGTNASDLGAHRPGTRAMRKGGCRSPLAELGIGKEEIRELARHMRLSAADRPSMACLASRFPYGMKLTALDLRRVADAECFLRKRLGIRQLRVRDHSGVARIEVGREERKLFFREGVMDEVHAKLKSLGFSYVTLDLRGYRSGSMDEGLDQKKD